MRFRSTLFALIASGMIVTAAQAANVLVVLSDENHLDLKDGKTFETGFYLNELIQPVEILRAAGHQLTFATPKGLAPSLDKSSVDPMYYGGDTNALAKSQAVLEQLGLTDAKRSPVISLGRVEQLGYQQFDAVYIPGGHAPMQDLLSNTALGKLLKHFHQQGKPTALVCHGPIALLSTLDDAAGFTRQMAANDKASTSTWIYKGYNMTVISNLEEEAAKASLHGGSMKFYPQDALQAAGAAYASNTKLWEPKVVVDRELITGENPASAVQAAQALLAKLK